jgi:hypothetical protein
LQSAHPFVTTGGQAVLWMGEMAGRAAVQDVLRQTLEKHYAKGFEPVFAWSSRVRKNSVPFRAVDDMRNAVDHFARALLLETALAHGKTSAKIGDVKLSGDPMIDAARGRRHMISAEFECLYYIATWRMDDIKKMLKSPLLKHLHDPKAALDERDACIDDLADVGKPNTTSGAKTAALVDAETRRTIKLLEKLTEATARIDVLWKQLREASRTARVR